MKLGLIEIETAYLGNLLLDSSNAFIGTTPLIDSSSGPTPVVLPYDEIWYTTSDSMPINISTNQIPSVLSNTYSDGKGIIKLSENLTRIESASSTTEHLFSGSALTHVDFPDSLVYLGKGAFYSGTGADNGMTVKLSNSLTTIASAAFNNTYLVSLNIPSSVTDINNDFMYIILSAPIDALNTITVESGNTVYDSRNNCNALIETSTNTLIKGCKNTIIPSSVTSIGLHAFYYCSGLTSINIPSSVTSIGLQAFSYCNNAKITFNALYSTLTNKINTTINNSVFNIEFNISSIPSEYNISSLLAVSTSNKTNMTYNIYTDLAECKDQALALATQYTIVNVYHIDGTAWT